MIVRNENEFLELIGKFKNSWKTTGGKKLAFKDKYIGQTEISEEALKHAYAPSTQRALKNPNHINTKEIERELISHLCCKLEEMCFSNAEGNYRIADFDLLEKELADRVRNTFRRNRLTDYTYGNAQKWINVALKYMVSSNNVNPTADIFKICYVPIDRRIQIIAKKKLGVGYLNKNGVRSNTVSSWGKCDNWDDIKDYQRRLKEATDAEGWYSPLAWEIANWE